MSSRLLDLTGINPATKKPWGLPREVLMKPWNLRLYIHWDNHQHMEDGTPDGMCLHWTAGRLNQLYSSYPLNFPANDKGEAFVVRMLRWHQKPAHLWGRNGQISGAVLNGNPEVPTWRPFTTQVDLAAKVAAEVCAWKRIDPRGHLRVPELKANRQATVISATGRTIQVPTVWDHAAYAKQDGYGRFRYDARAVARFPDGRLDDEDMFTRWHRELLAHYDALKAHRAEFEFKAILA